MLQKSLICLIFIFVNPIFIFADSPFPAWEGVSSSFFKKIDNQDLRIYDLPPTEKNKFNDYTVLCFFGGGWTGGSPKGSYASQFAKMGFRVFAPEYRIKKHFSNSSPIDSAEDAISAYDWLVENAAKLKINKNKIIVTGYSAGGHVAAMIPLKSKSKTRPCLMLFYSAVLDVSKDGYQGSFVRQLEKTWKDWSPLHLLNKSYPQTMIFAGEKDTIVKNKCAVDFHEKLTSLKIKSSLNLFPDYGHGLGKEAMEKTKILLDQSIK